MRSMRSLRCSFESFLVGPLCPDSPMAVVVVLVSINVVWHALVFTTFVVFGFAFAFNSEVVDTDAT